MNLESVEYGWIVTKFKETGTEVVFGNIGKITGRAFENSKHIVARQMHIEKINLRNKQEREQIEAEKAKAKPDPYHAQMM